MQRAITTVNDGFLSAYRIPFLGVHGPDFPVIPRLATLRHRTSRCVNCLRPSSNFPHGRRNAINCLAPATCLEARPTATVLDVSSCMLSISPRAA